MKKADISIRRTLLLLLAVVIVVVPLSGIACSDDEGLNAQFEASPKSGDVPLEVTFTDESEGDIEKWEWDFGDGSDISTDQSPTHIYTEADTFTVTLTVTDADGETDTATTTITTTGVVYEKMELIMNNPYAETDITGKIAAKFEELIENYTGGNVSVTVHYNSTLLQHQEQFEGLQTGAIDVCVNHARYVKNIDANLAPIDSLRGLVLDFAHGRAIAEDPDIYQYEVEAYGEYDIRYLGMVDSILIAGYLSNVDIPDYVDLDGVKWGNFSPGPLDPTENYFGAIGVTVTESDVTTKVTTGQVDCLGFPMTLAYFSGMYQLFNSFTMVEIYTPYTILMSEDKWDDMSPELQELITDTIIPEVQEYATSNVVEEHKIAAKGLKDNLASIYFIGTVRNQEVWEMLQDQPDLLEMKAAMDPELYDIINNLRPTEITLDPLIDEILTYAGIEH